MAVLLVSVNILLWQGGAMYFIETTITIAENLINHIKYASLHTKFTNYSGHASMQDEDSYF